LEQKLLLITCTCSHNGREGRGREGGRVEGEGREGRGREGGRVEGGREGGREKMNELRTYSEKVTTDLSITLTLIQRVL
jgi:hypothetical protein